MGPSGSDMINNNNGNLTNKRLFIIIQNISFRAEIMSTFSDTHRLNVTPMNTQEIKHNHRFLCGSKAEKDVDGQVTAACARWKDISEVIHDK